MTPLRAQFIRELTIRGRAQRTIHAYVASLAALAKHYGRPPDRIADEEIRAWLEHLRTSRKLSGSSLNVAVQAVRAFQEWVLHRPREQCVSGVRSFLTPLAPPPRATASRCFARTVSLMDSVGPVVPDDRVVGHVSGFILRQRGSSSPLGRRAGRRLGRTEPANITLLCLERSEIFLRHESCAQIRENKLISLRIFSRLG
jgi:hypothetical protein